MPRKKRMVIMIAIIAIIILLLLTSFLILYFNTDLFKSNQYLFSKCMKGNVDNFGSIFTMFENDEYYNSLEENKYTTNTQIDVGYTEGTGTTLENTDNDINRFKLAIDGKNDDDSSYDYQKMKLLDSDEDAMTIEYIKEGNENGIRFSDIFKQYILVNDENLKKVLEEIGYNEGVFNILSQIQNGKGIGGKIQFSEEEKETLKEKYTSVFNNDSYKNKITKKSNVSIKVGDSNIAANQYTLTLTKEQLNGIYIKILEMLKQDDIILSKVDALQDITDNYQLIIGGQSINNKEEFIYNIDETIKEINKNNIGNDETKIIVYEKDGNTLRTTMQGTDHEINIDFLKDQKYMQININDTNKRTETLIEVSNKNNTINITVEKSTTNGDEKETDKISIDKSEKVNGNSCETKLAVTREKDSNKIDVKINRNIKIVDEIEDKVELKNESTINLDDLSQENYSEIMNTVTKCVSEKVKTIYESINKEEISKVKEALGIKEKEEIQLEGISETEKNRFNSKFEMLKGEGLKEETIKTLISECKSNLTGMKVVSNQKLKLKIELNGEEQKANEIEETLTKYFEKNKNDTYDIDVEYNKNTGLAEYIVLIIEEKK